MKKAILTGIFLALLSQYGKGQYIEMKFLDILNKKQLTSSFVTCMTHDTTGFIWVGTSNGLNRFDGYDVKPYQHIPGDSLSLLNNNINTLYTDNIGKIWVGTNTGLSIYNPLNDNFETIAHESSPNGLNNVAIQKIKNGPDKRLYVSAGNTIHLYDKTMKIFKEHIKVKKGEISNFVFDKTSVWVGVIDEGLYHFGLNGQLIKFYGQANNGTGLLHNSIMDLGIRGNELWIATNGGGINKFDIKKEKFTYLEGAGDYTEYATDVLIDNKNRVWTIDVTGLKYFYEKQKQFYGYYPVESDNYSIKPTIAGIFQDTKGNYWTLHSPGGLGLRIPPRGFTSYSMSGFDTWNTTKKNVSAIAIDGQENLWIGYGTNGIDVFNWKNNVVTSYSSDKKETNSLGEGSVFTVFKDSKNRMWVGTYKGGLQLFDPEKEQFISYIHNTDNSASIAANDVRDIIEDKDGNLWIVTHGKGIDKFDLKKQEFTHYVKANSKLANDWAFELLLDHEENIWVATVWGLSKLKKGAGEFENFYKSEVDKNTISDNRILCLHQDKLKRIWVATPNGLNLYNPAKNDFSRIVARENNMLITSILSDKNNNLWISTLSGLKMFNPDAGTWLSFGKQDGLCSEEYHMRSAHHQDFNYLYFGGTEGVDKVEVDKLFLNKTPPKVILTDFQLFYKSIVAYGKNSPLQSNITFAKEIVLDYTQNIIGFEFAALNMNQAHKNQYAYQMVGFDKEWVYSGTRNNAIYTNLDPGKYTFRVKASNNDGIWNNEGTSIKVIIKPPWWQTWWARLGMVALLVLLTSLAYILRIKVLKRQKIHLEKLVAEKTQELNTKNEVLVKQADDLNNVNTALEETQQHIEEQAEELQIKATNLDQTVKELEKSNTSKNRLFSIISHDLRSPFNSILGLSELLAQDYMNFEDNDRQEMAKQINLSSHRIYGLLENLLAWAKTQINKISYSPVKMEVTTFLENILEVFVPQIEQKRINFLTNFDYDIIIFADKNMMDIVFRNLLSNAFKFTDEEGTILLSTSVSNNDAIISIQDSGTGITEDVLKNLFEISKEKVKPGTKGEPGSGLGLILCKEFIEKNKGKISVETELGKGSTFFVTIPIAT